VAEHDDLLALDQVLKDFGVFPQEALFIGDSLSKDGMVAASRGIRFVWAHYGHHVPAEYEEMVNYSLKPRREEKAAEQLPSHLITAVAARYEEVLNHI
jgi:FMN phosphatase YigB (HAD superfamily)